MKNRKFVFRGIVIILLHSSISCGMDTSEGGLQDQYATGDSNKHSLISLFDTTCIVPLQRETHSEVGAEYYELRNTFTVGDATIDVIGYYDMRDSNFTPYDLEYFVASSIVLNGDTVRSVALNYDLSQLSFSAMRDSCVYIKENREQYFILFGRPFFCHGHHCSDVVSLVISRTKTISRACSIWTSICNESLVRTLICARYRDEGKVLIPTWSGDCYDVDVGDSIVDWISVDNLKYVLADSSLKRNRQGKG